MDGSVPKPGVLGAERHPAPNNFPLVSPFFWAEFSPHFQIVIVVSRPVAEYYILVFEALNIQFSGLRDFPLGVREFENSNYNGF